MTFYSILHPVYPVAVVAAMAGLATVCSYGLPFYRRALAVEDRTRLTPLDGLRGILCFAVLCHHALVTFGFLGTGQWRVPPSNFCYLLGQTPVALFFCVTAFLFWSRVVASEGELPPRTFLRARLCRIAPLYALSGLLALAVAAPRIDWGGNETPGGLGTMALLGLRRWGTVGGVNLSQVNAGVTWTLQYEWAFYLLLPALALLGRDPRHARRLWLVPLGLAALCEPGPAFFFLPGVLAVYACHQPHVARWLRGALAAWLVVLTAAAFPWVTGDSFSYPALALTTVIFLPVAAGNSLFGVLNWRGLRLLGLVSYSVYLLHGIVLYAARPFLARAMHAPTHVAWHYWGAITGCAAGTLGLCLLTYRWVEWPCMALERRWRNAPKLAARTAPADAPVPVLVNQELGGGW